MHVPFPLPFPQAFDPFSEFAVTNNGTALKGFRGFAAGTDAVCSRTCDWYTSVKSNAPLYNSYVAARSDPNSPLQYILTADDDAAFGRLCAVNGSSAFGFPGRKEAFTPKQRPAPMGGFWWWRHDYQVR